MDLLLTQLADTSLLEWIAVILAIAYVLLAALESSWCWLCAFISTAIYTFLFWQVTLPFQSALNGFYMVMAVYGYYQWKKGSKTEAKTGITRSSFHFHLTLVPCLLFVAYWLSQAAEGQFNSDFLWLDASIHLLSMATTFMVAHKILENWIYWFFINIASAYLYAQSGLVLTAILFVGYVGFSLFGYWQWRQQWNNRHASGFNSQPAN
ncbi:nicotinamide riboside transporter PnuC [Alteromonas sp. ASW11-130]|uniref:nicotinamide riboside transporter PnuC n=1 Tax=Alteromonas sp. ASW11-130 TaxID=3015775 RepID=UPI002241BD7A|nr:nicotinamide riboside transporter PnuC [Alteromonas sp. ASW11-130]MCW8093137.1 nicotinamide riboside transporter PnuC [Alteromonas sp. ASW11-130]